MSASAQESALACVDQTFRPNRPVATCQSGKLMRAMTCHGAYCGTVAIECCGPAEAGWTLDDAAPSKPFPDRNKLAVRTDIGFVSGLMRFDDTLQLLIAYGAGIDNVGGCRESSASRGVRVVCSGGRIMSVVAWDQYCGEVVNRDSDLLRSRLN